MPPFSMDNHSQVVVASSRSSFEKDSQHLPASVKFPISPISERAVEFNPLVEVNIVPNNENDFDQISATWYSDQELQQIRSRNSMVARRLARRSLRSSDCTRGVEVMTAQGFQKARSNRVNGVYAVLSEQYKQRQHGIVDCERIAMIYSSLSYKCCQEAVAVAEMDALEAFQHRNQSNEDRNSFNCWVLSPAKWFTRSEPVLLAVA